MKQPGGIMGHKKDRYVHIFYPTLIVLAVMAGSKMIYNVAWKINNHHLHWLVSFISGMTLNGSIAIGASIVYPIVRFRGARPFDRILACLITPLIWDGWEIIRVTEYFPPAISLYYGLNPLFLGAIAFSVFQMGLWEIICCLKLKFSRNESVRIVTPVPMFSMLFGVIGVFIFSVWGMGAHWFYFYGQVYKTIFQ